MNKNYYVIVLPMALDGTVNRQIYSYTDFEAAKQAFHTQCGKYFMNASLQKVSACILDDYCNKVYSDSWERKLETATE